MAGNSGMAMVLCTLGLVWPNGLSWALLDMTIDLPVSDLLPLHKLIINPVVPCSTTQVHLAILILLGFAS